MGNLGFALLTVTAIVPSAAGLWPWWPGIGLAPEPLTRAGPERAPGAGRRAVLTSVVVDGLPSLGADLGGVLADGPLRAAVCWFVLAGRRVSWQRVALLVIVAVVVVAGLRRLRPAPRRSRPHPRRTGSPSGCSTGTRG